MNIAFLLSDKIKKVSLDYVF